MKKNLKEKLEKEVWRSDTYYVLAKKGSLDTNHPGMKILQKYATKARMILDLGCGEGSRLNFLSKDKTVSIGIDISRTGIDLANKNYPKLKFIKADLERTSLNDESFDLIYSAYVFEHLVHPEKVLLEAIRLLKKHGFLILIAPNYGSPNRSSPPFRGSRSKKFVRGLWFDLVRIIKKNINLNWSRVNPTADHKKYDVDWDTTIEPYIGTLMDFLRGRKMLIKEFTTCWSEELSNAKPHQIVFRFFADLGIYPFTLWGPHMVVVAQKADYVIN